jgi:ComF family protein
MRDSGLLRLASRVTGKYGVRALALGCVDLLYPPACHLCGDPPVAGSDGLCCASCRIGSAPPKRCGRCAARLPRLLPNGATCAACHRRPLALDHVVALTDYSDPGLRKWILALKHGGRADLLPVLGAQLANAWAQEGRIDLEAVLVPVPLHPLRAWERGHDQAAGLARELSRQTGLAARSALRRTRATLAQGAPGARSRRANVAGAFADIVEERRHVAGRRVWIVDDVATSGSTLEACARVVRRMGARRVGAVVLARAAASDGGDRG